MTNPAQHSNPIIRSSVYITGDPNEILYKYINNQEYKILSMSECGEIPLSHPNVIGGQCLLPPIDVLIAAEDNEPDKVNMIYTEHFQSEFNVRFMTAILAYLYNGGKLIIFFPDFDSNEDISGKLFLNQLWMSYGILPGTKFGPGKFDIAYNTKWLDLLYYDNMITPTEYLLLYNSNTTSIPNEIIMKLIYDLKPYGIVQGQELAYINNLRLRLAHNANVISPLVQL